MAQEKLVSNEEQEKMKTQISEILIIRGAQEGLDSDEDVVRFAVEQLWHKVMASSSAELYHHCLWRKNLR